MDSDSTARSSSLALILKFGSTEITTESYSLTDYPVQLPLQRFFMESLRESAHGQDRSPGTRTSVGIPP
jgi:hypothetical protein